MSSGAGGGYRERPLSRSISGLRQRRGIEATDGSDPGGLCRLPLIEILATNIGTIDDLIAIAHSTKHLHTHGRLHNRREAAGHRAKLEADIGNILALREPQRSGIQAQGIVVGGQQVTGQSPVVIEIGLKGDLIVQARIVGTRADAERTRRIRRNAIMPEEVVERDIGGIGNTGEVIAHGLTGLHFIVAVLLDGHAQVRRLIVSGEFDDLTGILDLSFHLLATQLIIFRCGHLRHEVAAKRQGAGSGNATRVCHDIAHDLTGTGLRDLKHSAFQRGASKLTCDGVVFRAILPDLDLTRHSTILPLDLCAFTTFDIDGFVLLIADVALGRLQFTDIVLAGSQFVINVDVAILIRRILANGILACIVQDELDTIDTLAGSRMISTVVVSPSLTHALTGVASSS